MGRRGSGGKKAELPESFQRTISESHSDWSPRAMKDREHQWWWSFQACLSGEMRVLLMKERHWACWAQCGWKEKAGLRLASVHVKGENGTAEWDIRQELKTTWLGLEWRNQGEVTDVGVICTDIIQGADRTFVAGERAQGPGWTFTNAQRWQLREQEEERPGRRQIKQGHRMKLPWKWVEGISRF